MARSMINARLRKVNLRFQRHTQPDRTDYRRLGNAQTLFPGISSSPYRNPEDWSLHHRPASSWDFVSAPCFWLARRPPGKRSDIYSAISYSPHRKPEAWECAWASDFFFGLCFCPAVFWFRPTTRYGGRRESNLLIAAAANTKEQIFDALVEAYGSHRAAGPNQCLLRR
jgi:hypothetical protein